MDNFFQKNNLERQKGFILDTIKIARMNPMSRQDFDDWYYSKREILQEEQEKFWLAFNKASVHVETLPEYKILLEELEHNDKDWIVKTLAHENAHANRGEQLGADHEGYIVTFIKKSDGSLEHQPAAIVDIPEIFKPEDRKQIVIEIATAPDTYERENNYLSDGDAYRIKNPDL